MLDSIRWFPWLKPAPSREWVSAPLTRSMFEDAARHLDISPPSDEEGAMTPSYLEPAVVGRWAEPVPSLLDQKW